MLPEVPNETQGTDSEPLVQVADGPDGAEAEGVRRFIADAVQAAGGTAAVAAALKYSDAAVRSWRYGKQPPPETLFRLAKLSKLSLDKYALTPTMREELNDLRARVEALEAGAA